MQDPIQYCPICKATVEYSARYPNYICSACTEKITDRNGEQVYFGNAHMLGFGCEGYYKKTNLKYSSSFCYVNGTECLARESYFGGIVIEKIELEKIFEYGADGGGAEIYRLPFNSIVERGSSGGIMDDDAIISWEKEFSDWDSWWSHFEERNTSFWIYFYPRYIHPGIKEFVQKEIDNYKYPKTKDFFYHKEVWENRLKG